MFAYSQVKEIIEAADDGTPTVRCKCKDGGCYAGCRISFRPTCATGATVDCSKWAGNCSN